MVTDIIFDLGGVLLDLDMQGIWDACQRLGINPKLFFVKSDADNTSTVCQGISASRAITYYQVGKMTSDEFLTLILSHCAENITREMVTKGPKIVVAVATESPFLSCIASRKGSIPSR